MRPAHFFAGLFLAATLAAFGVGCSNEQVTCYPDDYRACYCVDGRRGYQQCKPDESGYGLCDCSLGFMPDAGTTTGGASTSSGGYQSGT